MDGRYIQVYENTLTSDFCQELIDMFESHDYLYEIVNQSSYDSKTYFNQINISTAAETSDKFNEYHNHLIDIGSKIVNDYVDILPSPVHPKYYDTWEGFRIKRYMPGGYEGFGLHADSTHHTTNTRWLAFFWYLNTVDEGGSTTFLYHEEDIIGSVEAKQGRCLVFPPTWTYPHKGDAPISSPKYIVGSYLHIKGD